MRRITKVVFVPIESSRYIIEMPIFDGRAKEWRILNLTTGTIYSRGFDSQEAASDAILIGEVRGQSVVSRVLFTSAQRILEEALDRGR